MEYQCNLFVKFCYDKYIRWNTINLLIGRLKIDVQTMMFSPSYLRSIYYTFHLIDKLLLNGDFTTTIKTTKNKNSLSNLWKVNQTNKNKNENDTKRMKEMLKNWKISLEYISIETLRNNVFLVSIRANQCLNSLKRITFD